MLMLEGAMLLWLPRVLCNQPEEAREAAIYSVRELKQQIQALISEFNLTEEGAQASTQGSVAPGAVGNGSAGQHLEDLVDLALKATSEFYADIDVMLD